MVPVQGHFLDDTIRVLNAVGTGTAVIILCNSKAAHLSFSMSYVQSVETGTAVFISSTHLCFSKSCVHYAQHTHRSHSVLYNKPVISAPVSVTCALECV